MSQAISVDSAFVSGTKPSKTVDFEGRMTKFVTFAAGIRRFRRCAVFARCSPYAFQGS
jgi:hypothetical protein